MASDERSGADLGLQKLLNPDVLRDNLLRCAAYLTIYELLSQALIEKLQGFFSLGIDSDGDFLASESYRKEVLALHPKQMPFFASAEWFRQQGAISTTDIEMLRRIRKHRNFIAHQIPSILGSSGAEVDPELLGQMVSIIFKVDNWWLREIEIPTSPDYSTEQLAQVDLDAARSLRSYFAELIARLAGGDDAFLREMYELYQKTLAQE